MKTLSMALTLAALMGLMMFGTSMAVTSQSSEYGSTSRCEYEFRNLAGPDNMMAFEEYKAGRYGLGTIKSNASVRSGQSVFNAADQNRDNFLSMGEFCSWTDDKEG